MTPSPFGRVVLGIIVFMLTVLVVGQVLTRQGENDPRLGGVAVLCLGLLTILGLYKIYTDGRSW